MGVPDPLPDVAAEVVLPQALGRALATSHLQEAAAEAAAFYVGLCLDGEADSVVIDAAQLRQALAPYADMVRLIVLSACAHSEAELQTAQRPLDWALAHQSR